MKCPTPLWQKDKAMKTRKIITALMGASALSLAIPAAAAPQNDERGGRWGRANAESNSGNAQRSRMPPQRSEARTETRAARPTAQRQERSVAQRQERVQTRSQVDAAPRARTSRGDAMREWTARNERREARETRREAPQQWSDRNRTDRRVTTPGSRNEARRDDARRNDKRWNDNDANRHQNWNRDGRNDNRRWDNDRRRDNHRWNDRDHKRYSWDRDWRRDQRYNWKHYRNQYRHVYHAPRYYAPRGWDYGYRRFSIGISLWSGLYSSSYWIDDPYYYRLPPVYGSLRWVRYYDDALLVDIRTGYVVDVIRDFFW